MIGITGATSTGKTTLAKAVSDQMGICFVKSQVRAAYEFYGLSSAVDLDFDTRIKVQNRIIDVAEQDYRNSDRYFITDRTPIDFLAYTLADVQRDNLNEKQTEQLLSYFERCIDVTNQNFSSMIVLQPGIVIEKQEMRPTNRAYQEHINTLILGLVIDQRVRTSRHYIARSNLNINDRIKAVIGAMSKTAHNQKRLCETEVFH